MGREHRILAGLQTLAVPVPPVEGYCDDLSINEAPFYVMRFVDGHVLRDRRGVGGDVDARTPAARRAGRSSTRWRRSTRSISSTPASPTSAATTATSNANSSVGTASGTRARPANSTSSTRCTTRSLERIPEQAAATIVHGDYRLDNCMVDDAGNVVAVLDWEICTLGDPLADLGLLQVYWTGPGDADSAWTGTATTAPASGIAASWPSGTPRCRGATSSISTSTSRSRTGSWRASSRACTRAISVARSVSAAPPNSRRSSCRSSRRPQRSEQYLERSVVTDPFEWLVDEPMLHEPVLVVMLTGWIDAAAAGATAAAVVSTECETVPLAAVRRRHVHRLPGPPPDDGAPRRAEHRPDLGDDRTALRSFDRRSRRAPAHRPGTRHGLASVRRSGQRHRRRTRREADGRRSAPIPSPRRTPARRACRARRRRPTCSPTSRSPAARSTSPPAWRPRSSTPCTRARSRPSVSGRRCRTTSRPWRIPLLRWRCSTA